MNTPLQISFHNLPHSRVIEQATREAASRLEGIHDRIVSCRVIIDQPHRHHKEGNPYQVAHRPQDARAPSSWSNASRPRASSMATSPR